MQRARFTTAIRLSAILVTFGLAVPEMAQAGSSFSSSRQHVIVRHVDHHHHRHHRHAPVRNYYYNEYNYCSNRSSNRVTYPRHSYRDYPQHYDRSDLDFVLRYRFDD